VRAVNTYPFLTVSALATLHHDMPSGWTARLPRLPHLSVRSPLAYLPRHTSNSATALGCTVLHTFHWDIHYTCPLTPAFTPPPTTVPPLQPATLPPPLPTTWRAGTLCVLWCPLPVHTCRKLYPGTPWIITPFAACGRQYARTFMALCAAQTAPPPAMPADRTRTGRQATQADCYFSRRSFRSRLPRLRTWCLSGGGRGVVENNTTALCICADLRD